MLLARKSLALLLTASFSALSLVGQGLHLVPGLDHSPAHSACHSHCHVGHEHHAGHGHAHDAPGHSAHAGDEPGIRVDSAGDCDGCSICSFFAQGQQRSLPGPEINLAQLGYRDPAIVFVSAQLPILGAYSSRAPPETTL